MAATGLPNASDSLLKPQARKKEPKVKVMAVRYNLFVGVTNRHNVNLSSLHHRFSIGYCS